MEKNKRFEVIINDQIDNDSKDILQRYWDFNGTEFVERIGEICKSYGQTYHQFYKIIQKSSYAIIIDFCGSCETYFELKVQTQKKFLKFYTARNICITCEKKVNVFAAEQRAIRKTKDVLFRKEALDQAIENRAWENLTEIENRALLYFLESPYQDVHFGPFEYLDNLETHNLIDQFRFNNLIYKSAEFDIHEQNYHFSTRLPEKIKSHLKTFELPSEHFSAGWSRISFKLLKNRDYQNPDTPANCGTIIIEEDVFIKAGTKCLYGVWERDNENAWLSITPVSDVIVSQNKSIDSEPEPIKSILKGILRQN